MNLDEAIRHHLDIASNNKINKEYKDEYIQIAEWLIELKVRRSIQLTQIYTIQSPMCTPPPTSIPYESIA